MVTSAEAVFCIFKCDRVVLRCVYIEMSTSPSTTFNIYGLFATRIRASLPRNVCCMINEAEGIFYASAPFNRRAIPLSRDLISDRKWN